MGSLLAATRRRPLNRSEYLETKRSNISNKTSEGLKQRHLAYDLYENYANWKLLNSKYDWNDVVLRLLQENLGQIFSSAYLDEVQDLPHAAIYLICNLAGKAGKHWVCAGDPAQMISPGCSFTFDGLKETLLSICPGIESQLKNVHQLLVNYRTTKDILVMANTILEMLKQTFPGALGFVRPERAVKDLGLHVVTCKWQEAMTTEVNLGLNQVFIYSPSDSEALPLEANSWLGNHPFILSSLDSKGLEFDDVIVAFDLDRKFWDISRRLEGTLRMLRELYVAVTRAQRRVVILIKPDNDEMRRFFHTLKCEEMNAETIFQEFDHNTTLVEWFEKGMSLFEEEKYKLAAGCFTRAERHEWACFANGKHFLEMGLLNDGEVLCRKAARSFYQANEMNQVLDILGLLIHLETRWDQVDDEYFVSAIAAKPDYLEKTVTVHFLLSAERWDMIRPNHLADQLCSHMFKPFRRDAKLKDIVNRASDDERAQIEQALPWAHVDYHMDKGNHWQALDISLNYGSVDLAVECSERLLEDKALRQQVDHCEAIVGRWSTFTSASADAIKHHESNISLLLLLRQDPQKAAVSSSSECLRTFGRDVIRAAFHNGGVDPLKLLAFGDKVFNQEVTKILENRHAPNYTKVVETLVDAGFSGVANEYARPRDWDSLELLQLCMIMRERPKWLFASLNRNNILHVATWMILRSKDLSSGNKDQFRRNYDSYLPRKLGEDNELKANKAFARSLISCFENREILVEILFVWIYFERWQPAVQVTLAALESPSLVARNLIKILQLWEGCVNIDPAMSRCSQKILFQLALLKHALPAHPQFFVNENVTQFRTLRSSSSKEWLRRALHRADDEIDFGMLVVTFGMTVAAYSRYVGVAHDQELLQNLSNHFQELKTMVKSRHEDFTATNEKSRSAGARSINLMQATSETKVKEQKTTGKKNSKESVSKQKAQRGKKSKKQNKKKNGR